MAEPDPPPDLGRFLEQTVTFVKGEPGRYAKLHRWVFFFIEGSSASYPTKPKNLWGGLFGPDQGPVTWEAIVFMVALLASGISSMVRWYGVGQGYAVAAVPGLVVAALSLGLGVWMVTLAIVDLGVMFVVMGVAAAMTSVAAWIELLSYLEDEDVSEP